jgi:hypothetical protein
LKKSFISKNTISILNAMKPVMVGIAGIIFLLSFLSCNHGAGSERGIRNYFKNKFEAFDKIANKINPINNDLGFSIYKVSDKFKLENVAPDNELNDYLGKISFLSIENDKEYVNRERCRSKSILFNFNSFDWGSSYFLLYSECRFNQLNTSGRFDIKELKKNWFIIIHNTSSP